VVDLGGQTEWLICCGRYCAVQCLPLLLLLPCVRYRTAPTTVAAARLLLLLPTTATAVSYICMQSCLKTLLLLRQLLLLPLQCRVSVMGNNSHYSANYRLSSLWCRRPSSVRHLLGCCPLSPVLWESCKGAAVMLLSSYCPVTEG
jgi:hypothetical protein